MTGRESTIGTGRMLWTCMTPGCEVVGHFIDEPIHCSMCLCDLVGVYDATGTLAEDSHG